MIDHQHSMGPFSSFDLDELLTLIVGRVNQLVGCERCTVFIHDTKNRELWAQVASGTGKNEIRIPDTTGLAGECLTNGTLKIGRAHV